MNERNEKIVCFCSYILAVFYGHFVFLICYCLCVLDGLPGLNALVHLLSKEMEIMLLPEKKILQYAVHALASLPDCVEVIRAQKISLY